ncbi:MAG TPA: radical SAM protein, partial [Planctomycetota bacterium]|nr:radical SAM protein [Planctomycetota bacterium]
TVAVILAGLLPILIGGGEPTVYPGFESMVRHLKGLGLQVAVVTNGSRMDRIANVIDCFEEGDWIRLSLDSGTNETFEAMHKPKKAITLDEICAAIRPLRERNPAPLFGFSYIIVWEGAEREEGIKVIENIDEIVAATKRARDAGFSYISLKPFLTRRPDGAEVMDPEAAKNLETTITRIRAAVDEAKQFQAPDFKVIESINLRVLEEGNWKDFTLQPRTCHMQVLRQVLTPLGLFNCPAHRGVEKAKIGPKESWSSTDDKTLAVRETEGILQRFDASHECREVTCLYHQVNWWIEDAIENGGELEAGVERYDAFL